MGLYKQYDDYGRMKVIPILKKYDGFINIEPQEDEMALVDILATGKTKNNEIRKYAIECKDRPHYKSTDYGKDGDKMGWLIEDHKIASLLKYKEDGYIPIYVMTFSDNIAIFWDISKIDWKECPITANKEWNRKTVEDKGKYRKQKITLMNNQSVWTKKIES